MVSVSWQHVNDSELCKLRDNGPLTGSMGSTDMRWKSSLACEFAGKNAPIERTAAARSGKGAGLNVEMWRLLTPNNTSQEEPILRSS